MIKLLIFFYNRVPLIINPLLVNDKYKLIVKCDIMIKKDLFLKIFDEITNVLFNTIQDNEYLIINLVPEILILKKDAEK